MLPFYSLPNDKIYDLPKVKIFAGDKIALTLPKKQILDSSKLKEFADDNFKFDKICRNISKRVENTAGKGEIARYEQFLLFSQCFEKTCTAGM